MSFVTQAAIYMHAQQHSSLQKAYSKEDFTQIFNVKISSSGVVVSRSVQAEAGDEWCLSWDWCSLATVSMTYSGTECTFGKLADGANISGVVDTIEVKDTIQKDLNRLEKWVPVNQIRLSKATCKVLYLTWGDPRYVYRLGEQPIWEQIFREFVDVFTLEKIP